jgi:Tfp pilus assembly protein PilF
MTSAAFPPRSRIFARLTAWRVIVKVLFVFAFVVAVTPSASAQYANDVDRRLAIEQYHLGLDKMKAGAFEQAAAAFLRAIRHDRNQPLAYYALGQAYARCRIS